MENVIKILSSDGIDRLIQTMILIILLYHIGNDKIHKL